MLAFFIKQYFAIVNFSHFILDRQHSKLIRQRLTSFPSPGPGQSILLFYRLGLHLIESFHSFLRALLRVFSLKHSFNPG